MKHLIPNSARFDHIKTFGHSMSPLLQDGDIIYFKQVPYAEIAVNDIIVFKQNNIFITHRVLYKTYKYIVTKGDRNVHIDKYVCPDKILGKVARVVRRGERIDPETTYLVQSTLYFQEISKVIRLLHKKGIEVVILKGLPLHLYYEETHPRRIFADCDILVKKSQMKEIGQLMKSLGYKKNERAFLQKSERQLEMDYYKKINGFPISFDIHTEPVFLMTQLDVTDYCYDTILVRHMTEDLFAGKHSVKVQGLSVEILDPTHLVGYLALHFFHHNFQGINRLAFLAAVLTKKFHHKDDWSKLQKWIILYHVQRFVFPVFQFAHEYFHVNIPVQFLAAIKPAGLEYPLLVRMAHSQSIFDHDTRGIEGIKRIFFIGIFSSSSLLKKMSFIVLLIRHALKQIL